MYSFHVKRWEKFRAAVIRIKKRVFFTHKGYLWSSVGFCARTKSVLFTLIFSAQLLHLFSADNRTVVYHFRTKCKFFSLISGSLLHPVLHRVSLTSPQTVVSTLISHQGALQSNIWDLWRPAVMTWWVLAISETKNRKIRKHQNSKLFVVVSTSIVRQLFKHVSRCLMELLKPLNVQ